MRRYPTLIALSLLLAGCQSVDVERAQPSLQIPAAWRSESGPLGKVDSVWWRNFHDSSSTAMLIRPCAITAICWSLASGLTSTRRASMLPTARYFLKWISVYPAPAPVRNLPPPVNRCTARSIRQFNCQLRCRYLGGEPQRIAGGRSLAGGAKSRRCGGGFNRRHQCRLRLSHPVITG